MRRRSAALVVLSALTSYAAPARAHASTRSLVLEGKAPDALTGVWRSEGYGFVFVAKGDSLHAYEVTRTTCVPSFTAIRVAESTPGVEVTYVDGNDQFMVMAGKSASEKRLHNDGAASDIVVRRIDAIPTQCATPTTDTPANNFDVFAQNWQEHYILFREKHADWPAIVASARARVTASTTPNELFTVLSGMIAPFEDAHTRISAPAIKQRFSTLRKGTDRVIAHGFAEFQSKDLPILLGMTDRQLQGGLRKFCNDQLQYGHVNDTTGYLRILGESGYTSEGGFESGLKALDAALDTIFGDPRLKGLVIDVRVNFGGADPYGLALASRLASNSWTAYAKAARSEPTDLDKWTPPQPSMVQPSNRPGFRGPVVELMGPLTISAGETTTQALMGRTPKVLRLGENTQGVFSDVLMRRMPNGWRFGLPNEVFRSSDGKTFDGPGIPPDIEVPVFAADDIAAGRDPGLERAARELYRKR
ncbi:MAG: S41 family peptidase [Gemmatimonadaceae bacterium]